MDHTVDLRNHTRRVQREIERWRGTEGRTRTVSCSSVGSVPRRRTQSGFTTPASSRPATPSIQQEGNLWTMMGMPPGSHLPHSPTPLWTPTPVDQLEAFISRHADPDHPLLPYDSPTLDLYISSHLLAPLLAHSTLISKALISLYLDDLDFLDHLDVLYAFWLGGDAGFSERVGAALFGKGQAGAGESLGLGQRERTRQRLGLGEDVDESESQPPLGKKGEWGIGLGVGLSDRARWPPGGSEMAYALRTTLLDDEVTGLASRGQVWEGIEDRVSFAVVALPDDDDGGRARWLNPQAIEALDFVHLVYSPPLAVAALLPTRIMDKYQQIHNLLLRLSRVDAVLSTMFMDTRRETGFTPEISQSVHQLRFQMAWFVTSLTRYILDTGIRQHWDVMRQRLERLKASGTSAAYDDVYEDLDEEALEADEADDQGDVELGALSQLESAHSLVLYHHIILNRILRACLLADKAGQQVTFKIMMGLLGLILDFGKWVKEVQRGVGVSGRQSDAMGAIAATKRAWRDQMAIFVSRLSNRLTPAARAGTPVAADESRGPWRARRGPGSPAAAGRGGDAERAAGAGRASASRARGTVADA